MVNHPSGAAAPRAWVIILTHQSENAQMMSMAVPKPAKKVLSVVTLLPSFGNGSFSPKDDHDTQNRNDGHHIC